ncbi:MAG: CDP-diacylglycerol--glycerol-3-phosphate 3-phosphatidyltransferase [Desulfovibrionaceae bacterium]|nr:CDP-diacylglycerol--glycerol-3-phosphate 3-phosphatidyltransferase [Desulfovibrionaceae bacterium]
MNLAVFLTISRIFLIFPVIGLLMWESRLNCFLAMILFSLASITDYFDGVLARRLHLVSRFGAFLDPLADKLLVVSTLVQLCSMGRVPSWIVILIICRELAVTGLRTVAVDNGIFMPADAYGKWKTGFQLAALIALLIHYPLLLLPSHAIGMILLYIALALTVFSGWNYFAEYRRAVREKNNA